MEDKNRIFGKRAALKLSLIISILLFFIMFLSIIYARAREIGTWRDLTNLFGLRSIFTFIMNTLTMYILFKFQFWVIKNHKNNRRRFALTILLGSFILMLILSIIFARIQWELFAEQIPLNIFLTVHFVKDLVVLIITLLFTALLYIWRKGELTMEENQKLSIENLQNRYDALKNQVDPHFLFNSLNTLNGLIGYDDDKAHEYVDQLSSVFRYTMQNKKIIHLDQELDFIGSYIYLMKIRYNESLQVEYNPDEKYFKYYILPFGLQILIENCIKHNVISNKYPLLIIIETTENETIRVKNTMRLKPDTTSSGVGLANLNERYQLIFNKEIKISQDKNFFIVEIPLIKEIENNNNKSNN